MSDVPISKSLILYNSGLHGDEPAFAIRPLGHRDYDRYFYKVGACFREWQEETNVDRLKLRLLIDVWHAVAFYNVPVELTKPELLRIPEYRDMLADDCLPKEFRHERD